MAATNRADKVKLLFKTLQKRYKHFPKPQERSLLECLMFAACLENASFDAAESAYSVLDHHYIDWNELRVSTPQEIADTLPMLPNPLEVGERIKKTLQWVFETTYMFDLEEYRKKTIGQVVEYLDSIPSCSPFMVNHLVQIGLGGHQIPFDEAALRIMRRLDLTKVNNGQEEVSGIERLITKNKGIEFATVMHLFGIEFFNKQDDAELLSLLTAIDKKAPERPWQEPEGIVKKADVKLAIPRVAAVGVSNFKPEIDLDDDENVDPVITDDQEESIKFIETSLAALGSGASTEGNGVSTSKKAKKPATDKPEPKKKTEDLPVMPVKQDTKEAAPVPKTDSQKKGKDTPAVKSSDKKADGKKSGDVKAEKKPKAKADPAPKKSETKKTTPPKKESKKSEAKAPKKTAKEKSPAKSKKAAESKTPQKATEAPAKSATKKLQQKKPR